MLVDNSADQRAVKTVGLKVLLSVEWTAGALVEWSVDQRAARMVGWKGLLTAERTAVDWVDG
jgi:hypothetical protein